MQMYRLLPGIALLLTFAATAQKNFSYTPEHPKPGDKITITYEPAGDLANTMKPVEAVYYQAGKAQKADDLLLEKNGSSYTGSFITDTGSNFVFLGFSADKKTDNNNNQGYYILLYEKEKARKGAYANLSAFYQYMGGNVGLERDLEKALTAMESETKLYPESRSENLLTMTRLQAQIKKTDALKIYQKEIETALKNGLKTEADYNTLETLYQMAQLPEQAKFFTAAKKEKFPEGKWVAGDAVSKMMQEPDLNKKKEMLNSLISKIETDPKWSYLKDVIPNYKSQVVFAYLNKKDWTGMKAAIAEFGIKDPAQLAQLYNSAAWEMQKTSDNMALAEEFSRQATTLSKDAWKKPGKKPDYMTGKQWEQNNKATYAMFADTYGMVQYKLGNYKKGLPYAKEAAILLNEGKDADLNNTYALLAEKALPAKQYKKEIEQFVKDGKSTGDMKEILKRLYTKEKKNETGFEDYYVSLEKENYTRMLDELRKSMLDETAPSFALLDLDGKKVGLNDLKGKVVIVDFWATWCGPCKASFPGMQKMVTKYKDNPDVKFVFIDTWEKAENKEKNAADFITSSKYSFHVLMDNEDKVVSEFKVDGIPTKFVIDKTGKIRFKSVGFSGSDDKLINELTAMIDIAAAAPSGNTDSKKAF